MDSTPTLDIRSSSIPRLRHSSQRAKYGGAPPTDAFVADRDLISGHVVLGEPSTNLTPRQKYTIARETVGSLIGKHVNRHNQRTGERDPWRYWGPGRKWEKREVRGRDVDAKVGISILRDEEMYGWDVNAYRRYDDDDPPNTPDGEALNLNAAGTMNELVANRNGTVTETYRIGHSRRKPHSARQRHTEKDWGLVEKPREVREDSVDDDWDLMSTCSAPV